MAVRGSTSPAEEPAEPVLVIRRVFGAPRDRVLKAWTKAQHFVQCRGPKGFTTPFCKIELRPGGLMGLSRAGPKASTVLPNT
jgi:uncharacterized protein YndB with AHSA1/START domain